MSLLPLHAVRGSSVRRWMWCALVLLGVSLGSSERALAVPPPPEFWDLTVKNNADVPITDIVVELFPTDPNPPSPDTPYSTFLADTQKFTIPQLSVGRSIMVGAPGLFGISKVTATAKTPDNKTVSLTITALKGDYNGVAGQEYMGFTRELPNGTIIKPTLTFAGTLELRTAALSSWQRWGTYCPSAVTDTKTFGP